MDTSDEENTLLTVDPRKLSLIKLRQFTKLLLAQIQRLENARESIKHTLALRSGPRPSPGDTATESPVVRHPQFLEESQFDTSVMGGGGGGGGGVTPGVSFLKKGGRTPSTSTGTLSPSLPRRQLTTTPSATMAEGGLLSEQELRSMEVLLVQLHKLYDDSVIAARERRLETRRSVEASNMKDEGELQSKIDSRMSRGEENYNAEMKFKLTLAKDKNAEQEQKAFDCRQKMEEDHRNLHRDVVDRIRAAEKRQRLAFAETKAKAAQRQAQLTHKREEAQKRVYERERQIEIARVERAKSTLEKQHSVVQAEGQGMVKDLLRRGAGLVFSASDDKKKNKRKGGGGPRSPTASPLHSPRDEQLIGGHTVRSSTTSGNGPSGQMKPSAAFVRLTKPKRPLDGDKINAEYQKKVDAFNKLRSDELDHLKMTHEEREQRHEEKFAEVQESRAQRRKEIGEKLAQEKQRLDERKVVQEEVVEQIVKERFEQRQEVLQRHRKIMELPALQAAERWDGRATNILKSVCTDLNRDIAQFTAGSRSATPAGVGRKRGGGDGGGVGMSLMDDARRPKQGFEVQARRYR